MGRNRSDCNQSSENLNEHMSTFDYSDVADDGVDGVIRFVLSAIESHDDSLLSSAASDIVLDIFNSSCSRANGHIGIVCNHVLTKLLIKSNRELCENDLNALEVANKIISVHQNTSAVFEYQCKSIASILSCTTRIPFKSSKSDTLHGIIKRILSSLISEDVFEKAIESMLRCDEISVLDLKASVTTEHGSTVHVTPLIRDFLEVILEEENGVFPSIKNRIIDASTLAACNGVQEGCTRLFRRSLGLIEYLAAGAAAISRARGIGSNRLPLLQAWLDQILGPKDSFEEIEKLFNHPADAEVEEGCGRNITSKGSVENLLQRVAVISPTTLEFVALALCESIQVQSEQCLRETCMGLKARRSLNKDAVDTYLQMARPRLIEIQDFKDSSRHDDFQFGDTSSANIVMPEIDVDRLASWINVYERTKILPASVAQTCTLLGKHGYKGILKAMSLLTSSHPGLLQGVCKIAQAMATQSPPLCPKDVAERFVSNLRGVATDDGAATEKVMDRFISEMALPSACAYHIKSATATICKATEWVLKRRLAKDSSGLLLTWEEAVKGVQESVSAAPAVQGVHPGVGPVGLQATGLLCLLLFQFVGQLIQQITSFRAEDRIIMAATYSAVHHATSGICQGAGKVAGQGASEEGGVGAIKGGLSKLKAFTLEWLLWAQRATAALGTSEVATASMWSVISAGLRGSLTSSGAAVAGEHAKGGRKGDAAAMGRGPTDRKRSPQLGILFAVMQDEMAGDVFTVLLESLRKSGSLEEGFEIQLVGIAAILESAIEWAMSMAQLEGEAIALQNCAKATASSGAASAGAGVIGGKMSAGVADLYPHTERTSKRQKLVEVQETEMAAFDGEGEAGECVAVDSARLVRDRPHLVCLFVWLQSLVFANEAQPSRYAYGPMMSRSCPPGGTALVDALTRSPHAKSRRATQQQSSARPSSGVELHQVRQFQSRTGGCGSGVMGVTGEKGGTGGIAQEEQGGEIESNRGKIVNVACGGTGAAAGAGENVAQDGYTDDIKIKSESVVAVAVLSSAALKRVLHLDWLLLHGSEGLKGSEAGMHPQLNRGTRAQQSIFSKLFAALRLTVTTDGGAGGNEVGVEEQQEEGGEEEKVGGFSGSRRSDGHRKVRDAVKADLRLLARQVWFTLMSCLVDTVERSSRDSGGISLLSGGEEAYFSCLIRAFVHQFGLLICSDEVVSEWMLQAWALLQKGATLEGEEAAAVGLEMQITLLIVMEALPLVAQRCWGQGHIPSSSSSSSRAVDGIDIGVAAKWFAWLSHCANMMHTGRCASGTDGQAPVSVLQSLTERVLGENLLGEHKSTLLELMPPTVRWGTTSASCSLGRRCDTLSLLSRIPLVAVAELRRSFGGLFATCCSSAVRSDLASIVSTSHTAARLSCMSLQQVVFAVDKLRAIAADAGAVASGFCAATAAAAAAAAVVGDDDAVVFAAAHDIALLLLRSVLVEEEDASISADIDNAEVLVLDVEHGQSKFDRERKLLVVKLTEKGLLSVAEASSFVGASSSSSASSSSKSPSPFQSAHSSCGVELTAARCVGWSILAIAADCGLSAATTTVLVETAFESFNRRFDAQPSADHQAAPVDPAQTETAATESFCNTGRTSHGSYDSRGSSSRRKGDFSSDMSNCDNRVASDGTIVFEAFAVALLSACLVALSTLKVSTAGAAPSTMVREVADISARMVKLLGSPRNEQALAAGVAWQAMSAIKRSRRQKVAEVSVEGVNAAPSAPSGKGGGLAAAAWSPLVTSSNICWIAAAVEAELHSQVPPAVCTQAISQLRAMQS